MARSQQWYEDLSQSKRRRVKARMLARAALVGVLMLVGYYVLPMDSLGVSGSFVLAVGLLLAVGVLVWHVRAIINSPFPRVGAYEGLLVGIPLLLCVFAAGYYVLGGTEVDSFTQSMNKVRAMYFTVTVFSTVGFGDITPKTDLARSLVTVQMIISLVVLGSVVRLLSAAVNVGLKRQSAEHPNPGPDPGQSAPATG
jgi:voltage-gated potassium channel